MRLLVADCSVDYVGRLTAHLPMATRLILVKADGSVTVHADDRAYKPLNWMSPPCSVREEVDGRRARDLDGLEPGRGEPRSSPSSAVHHDSRHELGVDPGLVKDGVEAHLQALLAEQPRCSASGWTLVRREYMTAIGPVDILCRDDAGPSVAVEIKRRGEIDGVEQLTRYLELLNRDPLLAPGQPGCSPPSRSSRRPAPWPWTAASVASSSTTTPCAGSTTRIPDCSEDCAPCADDPDVRSSESSAQGARSVSPTRWPAGSR